MCASYFDDLVTLEPLNFRVALSFSWSSQRWVPHQRQQKLSRWDNTVPGSALRSIWRHSGTTCTSSSSQKNPLSHKWSKGVVRQSRELRSHRQKLPLSEDKPAGQQRYQQGVAGGEECTFSKPGSTSHIPKAPRWTKTTSKLWIFWPSWYQLHRLALSFSAGLAAPFFRIYSDASNTVGVRTRLGWVLMTDKATTPMGSVTTSRCGSNG